MPIINSRSSDSGDSESDWSDLEPAPSDIFDDFDSVANKDSSTSTHIATYLCSFDTDHKDGLSYLLSPAVLDKNFIAQSEFMNSWRPRPIQKKVAAPATQNLPSATVPQPSPIISSSETSTAGPAYPPAPVNIDEALGEFHLFPMLVPELRCKIWKYSIVGRFIFFQTSKEKGDKSIPVPAILHVSQEARVEALKYYELCPSQEDFLDQEKILSRRMAGLTVSEEWRKEAYPIRALPAYFNFDLDAFIIDSYHPLERHSLDPIEGVTDPKYEDGTFHKVKHLALVRDISNLWFLSPKNSVRPKGYRTVGGSKEVDDTMTRWQIWNTSYIFNYAPQVETLTFMFDDSRDLRRKTYTELIEDDGRIQPKTKPFLGVQPCLWTVEIFEKALAKFWENEQLFINQHHWRKPKVFFGRLVPISRWGMDHLIKWDDLDDLKKEINRDEESDEEGADEEGADEEGADEEEPDEEEVDEEEVDEEGTDEEGTSEGTSEGTGEESG